MTSEKKLRDVFYGRTKGRPLRAAEKSALEDNPYLLDEKCVAENLAACFAEKVGDIHLEIGFGAGEHLIARAQQNPGIGFIGAEAFVNGIAKCTLKCAEADLQNVRIWPRDARPLLDLLPENSLSAIYLLYPDPWPKRRHWKRRMINDANLARFARLLKPGGTFYFATDWANYAAWTLSHLLRSKDFTWQAQEAKDWLNPYKDWASTRYEQKAKKERRVSSYLKFCRSESIKF